MHDGRRLHSVATKGMLPCQMCHFKVAMPDVPTKWQPYLCQEWSAWWFILRHSARQDHSTYDGYADFVPCMFVTDSARTADRCYAVHDMAWGL